MFEFNNLTSVEPELLVTEKKLPGEFKQGNELFSSIDPTQDSDPGDEPTSIEYTVEQFKQIAKLANEGDTESQYLLGVYYLSLEIANEELAVHWLRMAAHNNHKAAEKLLLQEFPKASSAPILVYHYKTVSPESSPRLATPSDSTVSDKSRRTSSKPGAPNCVIS